jgi:hypothetical protein
MIKLRSRRCAVHAARTMNLRDSCKIFVGKFKWKRKFGRSRHRWEDNIRMDLRELGCKC